MNKEIFFKQSKNCFFDDSMEIVPYIKQNCRNELSKVISVADDTCKNTFIFNMRWDMEKTQHRINFPNRINWVYQPADDVEWVYQLNRMRYWLCLGQAYLVTGEEKYPQTFVRQFYDWSDTVKINDEKYASAWRTLEAGIRLGNWLNAICYFKESPSITDDFLEVFSAVIVEHAEYLMKIDHTFRLKSNWEILSMHGLLFAGLMLPDSERSREYIRTALYWLEKNVTVQIYEDGTDWEQSPMYHNEIARDLLDVVFWGQCWKFQVPGSISEAALRMCRADCIWIKPDGNELAMGDSDEIDIRDIISYGAYIFTDPHLKYYSYDKLDYDSIWTLGIKSIHKYATLKKEVPGEFTEQLPDSGNFFFRSGTAGQEVFFHFRCGKHGGGHGHGDQMHVDLFANGEDILIDSGRYTYVEKTERREFKDMRAHNTCLVDGISYYDMKDGWNVNQLGRPIQRLCVEKKRYAYVEGTHMGYMLLQSGPVLVTRRIIFIKPDIFVISDEFYTTAEHDYQQLYHFNNAGAVKITDSGCIYESSKNKVRFILVGEKLHSSLRKTKFSREYNSYDNNMTMVTDFHGSGFTRIYTVVFLQADSGCSVKKIPVYRNTGHSGFANDMVEALLIKKNTMQYTVVLAHRDYEYISKAAMFVTENGCTGFGNVVVFSDNEKEIGCRLSM